MSRSLINLLPSDRIRSFRRVYFFRLATVTMLLLAFLVVVHGVFLLPSYLYVYGEERATQAQLDGTANPAADSADVAAQLGTLTGDATYLARLGSIPPASAALRAVLAVPRDGISVQSFTITPAAVSGGNGTFVITGTASTREALRAYNLALSQLPFVSNADLPIGAYAQESDIAFSMTLTGTLTP